MFANFCDKLVLIYTVLGINVTRTGVGEKVVLFNLATKLWETNDNINCEAQQLFHLPMIGLNPDEWN